MRSVVLAGGSGGLGAATARLLAPEFRLTVSYRANARRAEALADIAAVVEADITREESRRGLLDAAGELYGLVVFAGVPARVSKPEELEAAMMTSHAVNYMGPVLLAREVAERMRGAKVPGAIVLVASMQATAVFAGSTAYAGQKAALIQAAKVLA